MKTLRKNLLLLAFAAGAMLLIGNNMFGIVKATPPPETAVAPECTDGGPGASSCKASWSMTVGLITFSGGCEVTCQTGFYACCHGGDSKCSCVAN